MPVISSDLPDVACQVCAARALSELHDYRQLPRVTSDAKPWPAGGRLALCDTCGALQKLPDAAWLEEIDAIYRNYDIYHQSGGAEQPIFDIGSGVGRPRSQTLIRYLVDALNPRDRGRLLDFGCGTGAALRNFSQALPNWELNGSELSERMLPTLREIPGFAQLYTCHPSEIGEKFDLVTLIHSLEHVIEPVAVLRALRNCVEEDGHLFVQVPDCGRTPYDLVVADHLVHFTSDTLRFACERAGYRTEFGSDSLLVKELSWLGRPASERRDLVPPNAAAGRALAQHHLTWLTEQVRAAKALGARNSRFGIFGTSISATWLYGAMPGHVTFFVDEDPARINGTHMGLPILAPRDVPEGADVFIPLIPQAATSVARRLSQVKANFSLPPQTRDGKLESAQA